MILWWMLYLVAASIPIAAAAWLTAAALRRRNLPERGVWVGALVLSIALPVGLLMTASRGTASDPSSIASGAAPLVSLDGLSLVAAPALPSAVGLPVQILWITTSLLLIGWLTISLIGLRRIRRESREEIFLGRVVRIAEETGPAVIGLLRAEILLPRWVTEIPPEDAVWIVRHEEEHVRSGDPALLVLAQLGRVLVPWNPVVWFLSGRLVRAIEIDCDRRVLRGHPNPAAYGRTLLFSALRQPHPRVEPAPAFALATHDLERRIEAMTTPTARLGPRGTLALAAGLLLTLSACAIPLPTNLNEPRPQNEPVPEAVADEAEVTETSMVGGDPSFTPYEDPPVVQNVDEIGRMLRERYPPVLREAGIGGTVRVFFLIGSTGEVLDLRIDESSGHPALDEAALGVAGAMQFTPARLRGAATEVWVSFPIKFQTRQESADPPRETEVVQGPDSQPYDEAPQILNVREVQAALEAEYPPLLRNAGITGTADVWLYVDASGTLMDLRIDRSSGHQEIDRAALRVARRMEFEPAMHDGEPVAVWVRFPIAFLQR